MADNATDWITGDIPQNGMTQEQWNEKQWQDWLAQQQGGAAQEPAQQDQGGGMVAPYYSGQAPTGMGSDPKARLAAVFGAMKGAQPATDTGGGAAEIMAAIDEFPALSGYLKYGRTFGKSSDQSTDSWARSMGAVAGPMINALVQSQANQAQNNVAGANQRMSLLGPAMSQLADEPRPQMAPQNPRDYHANTLLQSADKALARAEAEMLKAMELGMPPDAMTLDDKALAEKAKTNKTYEQWAPWIQRHKAIRAQEEANRQLAQSRLGIGGDAKNMQTPVNGRPNAASKGAAMIMSGVPNAAKQDFAAALKPAGGGGPVNPVGGGGVMSPMAPARQGGGPTIWPSSRFRPPVPPAQALPPITLGPGDFKTGAVPMPAQTGGAVQPVATGGVKLPPQNPNWSAMENINNPAPEASAFPERPAQPARPTAPFIPSLMAFGSMIGKKIGPVAQQQALAREQAALPPQSSLLAKLQSLIQGQQANGPRAQLGAYMGGEYMDPERFISPEAAISQYMARR